MTGPVTAGTRLLALLGDPVAHSLSPGFQNAALRASALDAVYLALRCAPEELPGLLLGIARAGGGGNVTVPHKELAATVVERPSSAVTRTGACNTFWMEDGAVQGDNTDVAGFDAAARELLGDPAGARVLLLGAGGSAGAVLVALLDAGAGSVALLNRTPSRAEALLRRVQAPVGWAEVLPDAAAAIGSFDLVVNATPMGLHAGDPLPLPLDSAIGIGAALDLAYAPEETAWVRGLRARGVRAADGVSMLLHQGAAAFERWWRRPAPLTAMRAALPPRPDP